MKQYIWLHIRKAGGTSLLKAMRDSYHQVDRRVPTPFVALEKKYWNDNLNNYRMPLGPYENKRMVFAQQFLYDETEFNDAFKFAIVRNPYDRAVSMWRYLTRGWGVSRPQKMLARNRFDRFLEMLPELRDFNQLRHFATHTLPAWPDMTDTNGKLLLDFVGRLENINQDVVTIGDEIGLDFGQVEKVNATARSHYRDYYNAKSRALVEKYFGEDIEQLKYSF